ncbi:MAG: PhoU domain-containing protein [Acidobacteriota bacterium]
MIKAFFDLLRKDSLLRQAYARSLEMLEEDQEMFLAAIESLREHNDARIDVDIYAKDQLINAYEREVRRKVFTHLAVSRDADLQASLVLVSIVIDIERIGDLTKNIVDLALQHPGKLACGSFENDMRKIETTVRTMFALLIEALPAADVAKAKEVMSEHWWIGRRADEILNALIARSDKELVCNEAVSTALYVRFLKRISAHLMNIASSVVNPFDRIGFREDINGKDT